MGVGNYKALPAIGLQKLVSNQPRPTRFQRAWILHGHFLRFPWILVRHPLFQQHQVYM